MTNPAPPTGRTIAQKVFTAQDQRDFASASHDWNPMHIDAVAARRLLSGRQVVHGIHLLLHALELSSRRTTGGRLHLACHFANPVSVGDHVIFSQIDEDDGRSKIVAAVDGLICTEVVIADASGRGASDAASLTSDAGHPVRRIGVLAAPLDEAPGSLIGTVIELGVWTDSLARGFPQAAELLGHGTLTAIAQLSYFVGMVCPGLHSVFSSVQFDTGQSTGESMRFAVHKYDPRFRLFTVAFGGVLNGELRAFLRPPPQVQPSAREVAAVLEGGEFKGTHSLVVGGSRGLGETTAKIIAAGGGDVLISYATGCQDAEAVAADINALGRGRCDITHLDLRSALHDAPGIDPAALDAVYYFSTPHIFTKRNELFDRGAFDEFVTFYLQRFYELCRWLDRVERVKRLKVYLPSTVSISDRPRGMTEYAMAKAAAEVLAADLNRSLSNVCVVHTRLPRLATDQTASLLNISVAPTLDAMLSVVRLVAE